ncbi:universal stress protein [Hyperthermus butylicus]|uniref:Stress protein n=1 Tax=Hyperthermus butylicus (strain DSM 5456 / JCM 9403 / PLM1-5) TaxID=415426 RepID=A2BLC5_HYPBU|nr:universal stress protein [Hyperthermus butylicus]ABM80786.1 putative stress protein [Hyperthermus butylicus DSM 5456]
MSFVLEPSYAISYLFRRILVPVDGSESSMRALEVALDFARRYGSKVSVLHVHAPGADTKAIREAIEKRVRDKGVAVDIKFKEYNPQTSSVANEIISEIIEGGYDLVVLGARGNTANEDLMIGSVALSITINSATSVMIIR